ncbi:MAG: ABC transporter permease subunit [Rhodospirillaceae bacterium]|nr:MAG: ABC transporter permease subunit [Rhodospirillaceae bacterium]
MSSAQLRRLVLALPWLWLALFFLLPFLLIMKISLAEMRLGVPPYTDLVETTADGARHFAITFDNYRALFADSLYLKAYLGSLRIAAIATMCTLLIGYPLALAIVQSPGKWRVTLLLLMVAPFWTSFLVRIYAWIGMLRPGGVINSALLTLGIVDEPIQFLHTDGATILGIVYTYLPFMVLPLYARLERLDAVLLEAAADLGATPLRAFWTVTLPLSLPGILAGALLVFIPAAGEFVVPELLGGPDTLMIGKVLWSEFFSNRDWPVSAAATVALLVLLVAPILAFQALTQDREART